MLLLFSFFNLAKLTATRVHEPLWNQNRTWPHFYFFFRPGQFPQVTVERKMNNCGNSALPENPAGGGRLEKGGGGGGGGCRRRKECKSEVKQE